MAKGNIKIMLVTLYLPISIIPRFIKITPIPRHCINPPLSPSLIDNNNDNIKNIGKIINWNFILGI